MLKQRSLSVDEARRIAGMQGFKPCKLKGSAKYELLRTVPATHELVTWEELKTGIEENGLVIYEASGYLKVVKVRETGF